MENWQKKVITAVIALVLILSTFASIALANIDISASWTDSGLKSSDSLTVEQGEDAEFTFTANSNRRFGLQVTLLQPSTGFSQNIITLTGDSARPANAAVTLTHTIDTSELDGEYDVRIHVNEAGAGYENYYLHLTVETPSAPTNHAPTMTSISDRYITEGNTLRFNVNTGDADGDDLSLTARRCNSVVGDLCFVYPTWTGFFSISWGLPLPDDTSFTYNSGRGTFTFSPDHDYVTYADPNQTEQLGIHLRVSDGEEVTTQNVIITVNDDNRQPEADVDGPMRIRENQTRSFTVSGSDADSEDELTFTAETVDTFWGNLYPEMNLNPETGRFTFTPGYDFVESGERVIPMRFRAFDGLEYSDWERMDIIVINEVPGCTNPDAPNYDATATVDDGSCEAVPPVEVRGCTNPDAPNYDPAATVDDGSCLPVPPVEVPGCTNPDAPNYDPAATVDDGSCLPVPPVEVPGCTDLEATNYNEEATVNDGSCNYPPEIISAPVTEGQEDVWYRYQVVAEDPDGDVLSYDLIRLPIGMLINRNNGLIQWFPTEANVGDHDVTVLVRDGFGGEDRQSFTITIREAPVVEVEGCTDSDAPNYNPAATVDDGSCLPVPPVEVRGCTDSDAPNYDPDANVDDGSCLPVPPVEVRGCTDSDAPNYDPDANVDDGSCLPVPPVEVRGCTDSDAPNYDPDANVDDGSCDYPPVEVEGCTDPDALNYDPDATKNDDSCTYPPVIPPPVKIPGCTDSDALNYNPDATVNDGSCKYAPIVLPPAVDIKGCTDSDALNYNPDATIDDNSCEYPVIPPENRTPVMNDINDQEVDEGSSIIVNVSGTDTEHANLTYVARTECTGIVCWILEHVWYDELDNVLPEGANFNPITGGFTFSPDFDFVDHPDTQELVNMRFRAWDGDNFSAWETMTITVNDVNRLPQIVSLTIPESLIVGEEGQFRVIAEDADGDHLTYNWNFGDGNTSNQRNTVHIYNTPGEYTVTLTISDGYGSITITRTLTVTPIQVVDVSGCTDPNALNFNGNATVNDGSCRYIIQVRGCTDPEAVNYDAEANVDDDSCRYPKEGIRIMKAEAVGGEEVHAGDNIAFEVKVRNYGTQVQELQARALVYDLSLIGYSSEFSLRGMESTKQPVFIEVPEDVKPGTYLVQVYVGNDYLHEVTHRQIVVQ